MLTNSNKHNLLANQHKMLEEARLLQRRALTYNRQEEAQAAKGYREPRIARIQQPMLAKRGSKNFGQKSGDNRNERRKNRGDSRNARGRSLFGD